MERILLQVRRRKKGTDDPTDAACRGKHKEYRVPVAIQAKTPRRGEGFVCSVEEKPGGDIENEKLQVARISN